MQHAGKVDLVEDLHLLLAAEQFVDVTGRGRFLECFLPDSLVDATHLNQSVAELGHQHCDDVTCRPLQAVD